MSKRIFIKAVGNIDDELLERYDEIDQKLAIKRTHKPIILKITVVAACLCIVLSVAFAANYNDTDVPSVPDNDKSVASGIGNTASDNEKSDNGENSGNSANAESSTDDNSETISIPDASDSSDMSDDPDNSDDPDEPDKPDVPYIPNPPVSGDAGYFVGEDDSVFMGNYDNIVKEPTVSDAPQITANAYEFYPQGMMVVAAVESVLPDTYCYVGDYSSKWGYRVLKLKVKEVIVGENVPEELYYIMYGRKDPDLREYDDIIFAFRQTGVGEFLLVNRDKQRVEAFENLVKDYLPDGAGVIAYTDGKCDTSLWEKRGFDDTYFLNNCIQGEIRDEYDCPVKLNNTLEETVAAIRAYVDLTSKEYDGASYRYQRFLRKQDFDFEGADEVFEYIKPFENGYFAQREYAIDCTKFVRIINGFFTNESIYVSAHWSDKGIMDTGVRFTSDDIENAVDIGCFLSNFDFDTISPSHTDNVTELTLGSRRVTGKYVKHNGVVYGVVKIKWIMLYDNWSYVQDDAYYVVNADGTGDLLERDELQELIGADGIIEDFEYNEFIDILWE